MKIFICDDDKRLCEILEAKVRELFPRAVVRSFFTASDLLNTVDTNGSKQHFSLASADEGHSVPDILLLDIKLPDMDGITVAKRLRKRGFSNVLIFVTGEEEPVFSAFDVGAFHYLVKPVSDEKFRQVMNKAAEHLRQQQGPSTPSCLEIQSGARHIRISISELMYAEIFDKKIVLHLTHEQREYYGRLSLLEERLGCDFYRVHRSFLINLHYVKCYDRHSVTLENGESIRMARDKYDSFLKAYMEYNRGLG